MSKLSLEALSQRADAVTTDELLNLINGGTENDCHPNEVEVKTPCDHINDQQGSPRPPLNPLGEAFLRWWHNC